MNVSGKVFLSQVKETDVVSTIPVSHFRLISSLNTHDGWSYSSHLAIIRKEKKRKKALYFKVGGLERQKPRFLMHHRTDELLPEEK